MSKTSAIRTKCLKCGSTIRAIDAESWQNITSESELLDREVRFTAWWVHGRTTRTCREGGHHNPADR